MIHFIKDRCIQCGACSTACAVEHKKNHTLYDTLAPVPLAKKQKTHDIPNKTGGPVPHPLRCINCEEPRCMEACISGAMNKLDRVYNRWEKCVGCFMCIMNCPYGAILPFSGKAVKCDQCIFTEKPACVRACPVNAIVFLKPDKLTDIAEEKRWRERSKKDVPLLKARH